MVPVIVARPGRSQGKNSIHRPSWGLGALGRLFGTIQTPQTVATKRAFSIYLTVKACEKKEEERRWERDQGREDRGSHKKGGLLWGEEEEWKSLGVGS